MKSQIIVVVSDLAQSLAIREICRTLNLPYEETAIIEKHEQPELVTLGEGVVKPADRELFTLAKKTLLGAGKPMKRIDLVRTLAERKGIDPKKAGYRVKSWLNVGALVAQTEKPS
jgi:hypothetical protein